MPKPIIAEGAYPNLSDLAPDCYSARVISNAYATSCGELNTVLQYVYHSVNFLCNGNKCVSEQLKGIAVAEMMHLDMLAEALMRLGAQPVYSVLPPAQYNFYSTKFVAYSRSLQNMIEDDLMGEKYAIYTYERMLMRLKNPTLQALICRIIDDENVHVGVLCSILDDLKK